MTKVFIYELLNVKYIFFKCHNMSKKPLSLYLIITFIIVYSNKKYAVTTIGDGTFNCDVEYPRLLIFVFQKEKFCF